MKKGVAVSPGIAVANAFCIDDNLSHSEPHHLEAALVSSESARLDQACAAAAKELDGIIARVSSQIGEDQAAIFRAHRLLLRDPALLNKVKSTISIKRVDARTALLEALTEYTELFSKIQDEYLKERMADIRDVINRIVGHLSVQEAEHRVNLDEPVIVVASEILPSQALMFDHLHVAGIITETGGTTGHAAILARSLGIPAVSGLRGISREVQTGDLVALDGREGNVYLRPGREVESAYRKLQREYGNLRERLVENRHLDAVTLDGVHLELLANVSGPADAAMATKVGAAGVGLYRTEYLFLSHATVPDEAEQLDAYRSVIEAAPNHAVTIRTLDIGGDKQVPYLGDQREANPFMGWRSIRLTTAHPELFHTQLRAILRAGFFGKVELLFPMVSTLEEVQRLKRMVARAKADLLRHGVPFAEHMPMGVMLEVPAAALCIESIIEEVDFVSIGSNDLIQYVMAADRDNAKVAHLCEPFSPAIMRLLHQTIKACNAYGKRVTLCGEMAGRPRCFLALLGMGLRSLSMSPAFIPPIKELARRSTVSEARETADRILLMKTFGEIRGFLTRRARKLWPDVTLWDTQK
jgi:phosphoenolpyruvate-protein phosphotransferase (PTS system enzyme I)